MAATHTVKVLLFWDSEIAKDAYGLYFTGVVQKTWTFPTNRMISHAELVRKILKYRDMDHNLWSVRMTMRVPSFYKEHRMFYFNLYNMNNDNKMRYLWTIASNLAKEWIHIVSDKPSMLYPTINDDDNGDDDSDEDYVITSESKSDDNNNDEEEELQTQ
ncbi:hypothetical protein M9H77_16282 [Catharanthus roseus]|uniref:Uncharacterized protein n=1 Tax=Catharanthus roseus TaxID=4058 RepID=A0ACC0B1C1_CATRO|nr:hypothetical protein M9H77_16282 [Catharanthus roseus]